MVQDGSSMRSSYPESCIHGLSPDVLSKKRPQFGHINSVGAPRPAKSITMKSCMRPYPTSSASTTFRRPDPACKIEFRMILSWSCTLPPSTTLPWAHRLIDIWVITYGTIHRPSIHEPERLQVQSEQKEEALCCIETEEFMLHMFYHPSRYHPHFFTSRCIIPEW